MSAINILVISVATATSRREMQLHQLEQLGLSGEIVDAVTPDDLTAAELGNYRFSWARPLSNGEIACALSHRKAWGIAAKSNSPTLILEDDVLLSDDISDVLQACPMALIWVIFLWNFMIRTSCWVIQSH